MPGPLVGVCLLSPPFLSTAQPPLMAHLSQVRASAPVSTPFLCNLFEILNFHGGIPSSKVNVHMHNI